MNTKAWPVDRTAGQLVVLPFGCCQLAMSTPRMDADAEAAIAIVVTRMTTGTRTRPSRAPDGRRTGILSEQSGIDHVALGRPGRFGQDSSALAHSQAAPACRKCPE